MSFSWGIHVGRLQTPCQNASISCLCKILRPRRWLPGSRVMPAISRNLGSSLRARAPDQESHNKNEAEEFDKLVDVFLEPLPELILDKLKRISGFAPNLGPESRVLDIGSGTGVLIPHLQERGVQDILAVDVSGEMMKYVEEKFGVTSSVGNERGVRTWVGDVESVPPYQGPFDAAFFNAVFGNVFDQHQTLLHTALLLKPGGHIIISHPMGRQWQTALHASDTRIVPHPLPSLPNLYELIADLPLRVVQFVDETEFYVAHLQVPGRYALQEPNHEVHLEGIVVTGFGRGSKQMGVPTANIDPAPLAGALKGLPRGVYFGWAQLERNPDWPEADGDVHKMVMNIGQRPTVDDGNAVTVEVHILHNFSGDFHGKNLKVLALGFLRPEMKFKGLDALVTRIRTDISIANTQLEMPDLHAYRRAAGFFHH